MSADAKQAALEILDSIEARLAHLEALRASLEALAIKWEADAKFLIDYGSYEEFMDGKAGQKHAAALRAAFAAAGGAS